MPFVVSEVMPRGEVALIVALVGLQSRIVLPSTYAIVVFMTAVTTILAPPVLRYLFRADMEAAKVPGWIPSTSLRAGSDALPHISLPYNSGFCW